MARSRAANRATPTFGEEFSTDYHGLSRPREPRMPENRTRLWTCAFHFDNRIGANRDAPGQAVYRRATESGWISGSFEVKKRLENR